MSRCCNYNGNERDFLGKIWLIYIVNGGLNVLTNAGDMPQYTVNVNVLTNATVYSLFQKHKSVCNLDISLQQTCARIFLWIGFWKHVAF